MRTPSWRCTRTSSTRSTASWRRAARASLRSSVRVATVRYSASRFLEWSAVQTSFTTTGQRLAIWGDWSGSTIVDRLRAQIELTPRLLGATNRFQQGQRGILYIWRSSSGVTKPNALRLICSELLLDHLRVPTGYLSAPYWWLLRAVDHSGSTPSQRHFSRVSNNRQLALFRPLKAVARVRIPSGLRCNPPDS
jgi:hypothetical protein